MSAFDSLAGVALFAEDIFVLFAVLGSLLLLAWRAANLRSVKRRRAPELILRWAALGWLLGALCLVSVFVADWDKPSASS